MFLGRRMKGKLTMLQIHTKINPANFTEGPEARNHTKEVQSKSHDRTALDLPALEVGQKCMVYNHANNLYDVPATVIQIRNLGRSYVVEDKDGTILIRNRRLLKKIKKPFVADWDTPQVLSDGSIEEKVEPQPEPESNTPPQEPRKRGRPKGSKKQRQRRRTIKEKHTNRQQEPAQQHDTPNGQQRNFP
jgi:hypothetical protein